MNEEAVAETPVETPVKFDPLAELTVLIAEIREALPELIENKHLRKRREIGNPLYKRSTDLMIKVLTVKR